MADLSALTLPHGTIPTQMFGNVNLQNAVMFINENFQDLLKGINANTDTATELLAGKSSIDHTHDEAYAAYGHVHSWQEITGLSAMLDGKAELNHEHAQYLSSLPAHYHDINGIQGLGEAMQGKADATHGHTMAQVDGLGAAIADKASTAYVDQQVANVSDSVASVAQEVVTSFAADSSIAANAPKDVVVKPDNETEAAQRQRIGKSVNYARLDHQHVVDMGKQASDVGKMKHDGAGTDGAALVGTESIPSRIDHSHPLNVAVAPDTPSPVIKYGDESSPTFGSKSTYARSDHNHRMPNLVAADITYGQSTVENALDSHLETLNDHERRIDILESEQPEPGPVGEHSHGNIKNDGTIVDSSGKFIIGDSNDKLSTSSLNPPAGLTDVEMVKAISALFDYANSKFTLSTSKLHYPTSGEGRHQDNCFLTVNANGDVVHGGNDQYDSVSSIIAAFDCGKSGGSAHINSAKLPYGSIHSVSQTQHKRQILGIEASDVGGDQSVSLFDGLPSDAVSLGEGEGGVEKFLSDYVSADGVSVGSVNGVGSGVLVGENGKISSKATVPLSNLPMGTGAEQCAYGNHAHTGVYADVNHTHAQYSPVGHNHAISDVTDLATELGSKFSQSNKPSHNDISDWGSATEDFLTEAEIEDCLTVDDIGDDSYCGERMGHLHWADDITLTSGGSERTPLSDVFNAGFLKHDKIRGFGQDKSGKIVVVDDNGGITSSDDTCAKFTDEPTGGKFVKTNGANGTIEEADAINHSDISYGGTSSLTSKKFIGFNSGTTSGGSAELLDAVSLAPKTGETGASASNAPATPTIRQTDETDAEKIARIGTSQYAARADHVHTFCDTTTPKNATAPVNPSGYMPYPAEKDTWSISSGKGLSVYICTGGNRSGDNYEFWFRKMTFNKYGQLTSMGEEEKGYYLQLG